MNRFSCSSTAANTGNKKLCQNDLSAISQVFFCPAGYSFATEAAALLEATWNTAIKAPAATRIYPFPAAVSITPENQEDVYQDRPLAGQKLVREGLIGFTMMLDVNKALARKLRSFNNKSGTLFFGDVNGNIWGWSDDNTKVYAFDIQELHVGSQKLSDGSTSVELPVKVVLKDTSQWNDYGVVIQPTWDINGLDGVYDVVLTTSAPGVTGVTISVLIDCIAVGDPAGQITGLVKADFIMKDDTPSLETITSSTDNGDGTYRLAATIATDNYTVNLVATSAISLADLAIEETAQATFVV